MAEPGVVQDRLEAEKYNREAIETIMLRYDVDSETATALWWNFIETLKSMRAIADERRWVEEERKGKT